MSGPCHPAAGRWQGGSPRGRATAGRWLHAARLWILLPLATWGCESGDGGLPVAPGVPDTVRAERTAAAPPALLTVAALPVEGRTGPGGLSFEVTTRTPGGVGHDRAIGRTTFQISLRSAELTAWPCGSCHVPGRGLVQRERTADVHANVQPLHPAESGAVCLSCHATDDVELLALEGGERVSIDHAYRLCAQCHFPQAEAWAGGAHGKRLDGWRGRRVVMGCADCHDPHRPAVAPRIPMDGPRLPLSGKPR